MSDILWFILAFVVIAAQAAVAFILGANVERGRIVAYLRRRAWNYRQVDKEFESDAIAYSAKGIELKDHYEDNI